MARYILTDLPTPATRGGPLCRPAAGRHANYETLSVLDYNYIRPHGGIGGRTQAEAAGIIIRGHDKRLTPFQTAAVAA